MTDYISRTIRLPDLDIRVACALALSAAIAWYQPFDLVFATLTFGQPVLRSTAMIGVTLSGLALSSKLGLRVSPRGERWPILLPLMLAIILAVTCAAVDALFRPVVPDGYIRLVTDVPLRTRTIMYMLRAFNEKIIYQLFLGPLLACLLGKTFPSFARRHPGFLLWIGFAVSQSINVWFNVVSRAPVSAVSLCYDLMRFVIPGLTWCWLYQRRGFQADEIASTSVHLFYQPLVGLALSA